MKRIIGIILMVAVTFTIVGCNNQNTEKQESQESTQKQNTYFGKINELVGNEFSLSLAKEPKGGIEEYLKNSQGGDSGNQIAGEGFEIPMDGETPDNEQVAPDGDGPQAIGEGGNVIIGEVKPDDIATLDLEYTGKKETLTIPAGVKVHDLRTGEDSKLSVIKKGSVIKAYGEEVEGKIVVSKIYIVESKI